MNQQLFIFVTRGNPQVHFLVFSLLGFAAGWLVVWWCQRLLTVERQAPFRFRRSQRLAIVAVNGLLWGALPVAMIAGRCQSLIEGGSIDWAHWRLLYQLILMSLLLTATVVDFDQYVIPDAITVPGVILGVGAAFAVSNLQIIPVWVDWNQWVPDVGPFIPKWIKNHHHWHGLIWSVAGLVAGATLTWMARIVSQSILGVEALGLGDVTLMGMIGSFIGWQGVLCVFLIAPACGLLVGLMMRFTKGRRAMPYGPCLAAATIVVLFNWRVIWERTRDLFGHWPTLLGMVVLVIGGMALLLGLLRLYRSIPVARRTRDSAMRSFPRKDSGSDAQP